MRIYLFDYETRAFLNAQTLDDSYRDPADPARYMVPGNATEVEPPVYGEREVPVLGPAGQWTVVADRRGEVWFDANGTPVFINKPGDPYALGLSPENPLTPQQSQG
jgi:hypothetical protein